MHEEPGEQCGVGPRLQSQEQLGVVRSVGTTWIDHDHARAALLPVRQHALEQHGMTPGGVGADQHEQIRLVEVLVAAGHGVGAESAAVAGDRRCHAEPRVGVDIGRADKALHQLVGDVIVLGQHLAGKIERDRVGAVTRDDVFQPMGDMIERVVPGDPLQHALAADHRMQQPPLERDGLAERRSLRA